MLGQEHFALHPQEHSTQRGFGTIISPPGHVSCTSNDLSHTDESEVPSSGCFSQSADQPLTSPRSCLDPSGVYWIQDLPQEFCDYLGPSPSAVYLRGCSRKTPLLHALSCYYVTLMIGPGPTCGLSSLFVTRFIRKSHFLWLKHIRVSTSAWPFHAWQAVSSASGVPEPTARLSFEP